MAAIAIGALALHSVSISLSFFSIVPFTCSLNKLALSSSVKAERMASRNASSLDSFTLGELIGLVLKHCFDS